jgi:hypothetical protein
MTKARDIADIVGDLGNNAGKAVVVNDAGTELVYGVAGGEVTSTDDAYKNYDTVSSDDTLTLASNKNYFLAGDITVADNVTWTISGTGALTII